MSSTWMILNGILAISATKSLVLLTRSQVYTCRALRYNKAVFQVRADQGRSYFRAEVKTWGQVCPRFRAQNME